VVDVEVLVSHVADELGGANLSRISVQPLGRGPCWRQEYEAAEGDEDTGTCDHTSRSPIQIGLACGIRRCYKNGIARAKLVTAVG
jgi:hypothetical protein